MHLADLPTPALILDRARLRRNTERMSRRMSDAGIALRPHLKTAKSADVAALATAGHSGGITVSTLAEAAYFLEHGFSDLTYAVCIVPDKLDEVAALQRRGGQLRLITDDAALVPALAERASALDVDLTLLIEIDSGEHRTGVAGDSPAVLAIAAAIGAAPRLHLGGVLTHGGHSYACRSVAEVQAVAEQERLAVVRASDALRAGGFECAVVSAGSTPTAVHATSFEGLTEMRPGVYTFFDLAQLGRGSCATDDLALSVLATVISHRPEHGRLLIDAGGLALSKDTSAQAFLPDAGYGWVCDAATCARIGSLRVATADQEHGFVEGAGAPPYAALPIGTRVRVLPNHACMTAAAYDRYYVIDGSDEIVAEWPRINGWRR